jgi:uncharacterized membrane protein
MGMAQYAASFEMRRGPIPDAEELIRYKEAHPEAPSIIFEQFRLAGEARRERERREMDLQEKDLNALIASERLGTFCALIIALVGFGCATFLVAGGHEVAGTVIFGLDVGALVTAFIAGRSNSHADEDPDSEERRPPDE